MGMFDSVFVDCPNCKTRLEFQSKSGPCLLKRYKAESVPVSVAGGLDKEECDNCGKTVRLIGVERISLTAVVDRDENEEANEESYD